MMRLIKWYWSWCGPHGTLGPSGGIVFVLSVIPIALIFGPPLLWLLRHSLGWWLALWF